MFTYYILYKYLYRYTWNDSKSLSYCKGWQGVDETASVHMLEGASVPLVVVETLLIKLYFVRYCEIYSQHLP